jgi:hypothetical protein
VGKIERIKNQIDKPVELTLWLPGVGELFIYLVIMPMSKVGSQKLG